MIWRLILVASAAALLAGVAAHVSGPLLALARQVWSLDKDQVGKLKDLAELAGKILAGLGVSGLALWKFIAGKPDGKKTGAGNQAVFHGKVNIGGDFVQGDKTSQKGGGDA